MVSEVVYLWNLNISAWITAVKVILICTHSASKTRQ